MSVFRHLIAPRSLRCKCKWFMLGQLWELWFKNRTTLRSWCQMSRVMLTGRNRGVIDVLVTKLSIFNPPFHLLFISELLNSDIGRAESATSAERKATNHSVNPSAPLTQRLIHVLDKSKFADWTSHSKAVWLNLFLFYLESWMFQTTWLIVIRCEVVLQRIVFSFMFWGKDIQIILIY